MCINKQYTKHDLAFLLLEIVIFLTQINESKEKQIKIQRREHNTTLNIPSYFHLLRQAETMLRHVKSSSTTRMRIFKKELSSFRLSDAIACVYSFLLGRIVTDNVNAIHLGGRPYIYKYNPQAH